MSDNAKKKKEDFNEDESKKEPLKSPQNAKGESVNEDAPKEAIPEENPEVAEVAGKNDSDDDAVVEKEKSEVQQEADNQDTKDEQETDETESPSETPSAKKEATEADATIGDKSDAEEPKDVEEQKEADNSEKTEDHKAEDQDEEAEEHGDDDEEEIKVVAETSSDENDEDDEHHKEIEDANAEDSEDEDNASRHEIELKDYDAMSMDALVIELENLLKKEKVQAIREHVTQIKIAFDKKFNEVTEEKRDEFISKGGNFIDFHYSSPVKTKFNRIYFEYREKRDNYYKNLKKNLNENLKNRLALIEELKGMIGTGRDMKATFENFKDLQERWKNAGPVPRTEYSQLWKNYHHHVERFYDFLHLDREFRDLDFQHNLDQKLKIISRAEELAEETDINRAFRELQLLHKIWKEELGPVAKEYREEIWEKFSALTKKIHENRRAYFEKLDKDREKHLEVKLDIIKQIETLANTEIKSHKQAQKNIKLVQQLRDLFFTSGKVPIKHNEEVWKSFKEQVRNFNRNKNSFYKQQKQEQNENLQKKLALIKIAEDNKDSDDFETVTPIMKKIQADWKKIGFVPRKYSDKIWNDFKAACNHYFDRFHAQKNEENKEEFEAFRAKKDLLDELKQVKLKKDKEKDLETIKSYIDKWKELGAVPYQKRYIEGKFNRALDQLFESVDIDKKEAELLKYENRIQGIEESNDENKIYKEVQFLNNKINDTQAKINQFENNLQFFSDADQDSPLVQEVHEKIDKLKSELEMWRIKLNKVKSL